MSAQCVAVGPHCPIQATDYGYWPSSAANSFFAVLFGVCFILQIAAGLRWRVWTFSIVVSIGCATECVGYIGRYMLSQNPFNSNGNKIQIVCLIFAPSFLAAGIYLTLKHLVIAIGPQFSLLRPKYYTWVFVGCDIVSLLLQVAGGALTATATDTAGQYNGSHIMLSGIVFQVFTLVIFGLLAATFFCRFLSWRGREYGRDVSRMRDSRLGVFLGADVVAYCAVLFRCIYRIPELAVGWRGAVFENQAGFIAMEGVMITIAVLSQTALHPGYWFPAMRSGGMSKIDQAANERDQLQLSSIS